MEVLFSEPFYSFVFVGAGLIFLLLEVFIPSGGILGVLALGSAAFGIYGLFYQGNALLGVGAIGGTSIAVILGIRFGLRRLSFKGSLSATTNTSVDERIEGLVGKQGITVTSLRPAGVAMIEGQRVDVVSAGSFVGKDVPVCVVDTSGNRVVVRVVTAPTDASAAEAEGKA
jgi:membrane-bound serine protease (ClpP class)